MSAFHPPEPQVLLHRPVLNELVSQSLHIWSALTQVQRLALDVVLEQNPSDLITISGCKLTNFLFQVFLPKLIQLPVLLRGARSWWLCPEGSGW